MGRGSGFLVKPRKRGGQSRRVTSIVTVQCFSLPLSNVTTVWWVLHSLTNCSCGRRHDIWIVKFTDKRGVKAHPLLSLLHRNPHPSIISPPLKLPSLSSPPGFACCNPVSLRPGSGIRMWICMGWEDTWHSWRSLDLCVCVDYRINLLDRDPYTFIKVPPPSTIAHALILKARD